MPRTWCSGAALLWVAAGFLPALACGEVMLLVPASVEEPAEDPADFVFSWDAIRRYEVVMAPEDRQAMLAALDSPEQASWETPYPAELHFEGQQYTGVAVRHKGDWGQLHQCVRQVIHCDKLSFKLKFSEYDASGKFFGLKRLNFHAMQSDKARMNEVLAYSMFRDLGVPAPRAAFASLVINGEELGLYAVVEQVDSEFVESRFAGATGDLFKEVWPATLELADADRILAERLETNRDEQRSSFPEFEELARQIQEMDDASYTEVMSRWFDLELLVRYLVVDRLVENFDGITAVYCFDGLPGCSNHNFYLYAPRDGGKHQLIPWDLDLTFPSTPDPHGQLYRVPAWHASRSCERIPTVPGTYLRPAGCDKILGGFVATQWPAYAAAMQEAVNGPLALPRMQARVDELAALLRPAMALGVKSSLSLADWEQRVVALKEEMARLYQYNLQTVAGP